MLQAAIELIEERGVGQLTVRAVAAAADVNVAAVSYHFGSKDGLIAAALEGAIRHMVEDSEAMLARMPSDPEATLTELLHYYLEGALRYPRLSKAHLYAPLLSDDYGGPFPVLMEPVLVMLVHALRSAVPDLGKREATHRAIAALSAVFFPAFFGGLFRSLGALDSAADRKRFAQRVAASALVSPSRRA